MDYPILKEYNPYPNIITISDNNPALRSPNAVTDLFFEATRDTLSDPSDFNAFIKSAESSFRASREYKAYKSYLIENVGINKCQYFGNITIDDADIELHHNILGLYDICLLITIHILNTVGKLTTFDLIEILIQEHYSNNIGITFLSKTAHQLYTNNPDAYIPPEQTFGSWWNLLSNYRFGITFDIANKILRYINKFQNNCPISINAEQYEQILSYASYNDYGTPLNQLGPLPDIYTQKENNNNGY